MAGIGGGNSFGAPKRIYQAVDHEEGDLTDWTDSAGNNNGGAIVIDSGSTPSPHGGTYQGKMSIGDTSSGSNSGNRNKLEGDNDEVERIRDYYWSAWYYIPTGIDFLSDNAAFFNLIQGKQAGWDDYPTNSSWTMYVTFWMTLVVGPGGTTISPMMALQNGDDGVWGSRSQAEIAASDFEIPINDWFHVEMYAKQATDATGRVMGYINGHLVMDIQGIYTEMSGQQGTADFEPPYPRQPRLQTTVNLYGNYLPHPTEAYIDDAALASYRQGPTPGADPKGDGPKPLGRPWSDTSSGQATCTVSYYLQPGDNRRIMIGVGSENSSDVAVSSVTFGGVSCSKVTDGTTTADESYQNGSWNRAEMWEIKEADLPADGTHDIVVTFPSSQSDISVAGQGFYGADQTTNVDVVVVSGKNPADDTVDTDAITTGVNDATIFSVMSSSASGAMRPDDGQSPLWNMAVDASASSMFYSHKRVPTAGATTMGYKTVGGATRWAHVMASIEKA